MVMGIVAVIDVPRQDDTPLSDPILAHAQYPGTGDLPDMLSRGYIRILTTYNPLFVSYQNLEQRGAIIDMSREFQKYIRNKLGKDAKNLTVTVVVVPRDELIPRLLDGKGDIIAANLTITKPRQEQVAFAIPNQTDVDEIIVTSTSYDSISSLDDVTKVGLHVRKSSSYYKHILDENSSRLLSARPTIPITLVDERLEDYDILEMMNAGMIPMSVVDNHKGKLWAQVFPNITIHPDLKLHTNGETAWAVRPGNTELLALVNAFQKKTRKGSFFGNLLIKKYLNPKWIKNTTSPVQTERLHTISQHIKKYSELYGFDWLLIAAQGYQESGLNQNKRSPAGAIGIMQVLPSTARDASVRILDISKPDKNIEAGVKYLKHLHDMYYASDKISSLDQVLFSLAAYNAGPGNIAKARRRAKAMGLDPNVWFENVEIAAASSISHEPVTYVRNIFKYYVGFKAREALREERQDILPVIAPEDPEPQD